MGWFGLGWAAQLVYHHPHHPHQPHHPGPSFRPLLSLMRYPYVYTYSMLVIDAVITIVAFEVINPFYLHYAQTNIQSNSK